jgi:ribosomal protein S18 acetylase RimI-like enzyme
MRFVILHYHIFKNAGTAIQNLLKSNFGARFSEFEGDSADCQLSGNSLVAWLERNPEVQAVSSHQLRYPKPEAPGFVFFDFCFLRDPIDRIYSIYTFFRQHPPQSDPLSALAHETTLGRFVAQLVEGYPHLVNDVQVTMLATDGAYRRPPGARDLARATQTLLGMSFPGVADCFYESMVAGQYFWKPVFPDFENDAKPANVSRAPGSTLKSRLKAIRSACGNTLYEELERLNALDRELVRRARVEVARRFRLTPDHVRRLAELRSRVREEAGGDLPVENTLPATRGKLSSFLHGLMRSTEGASH